MRLGAQGITTKKSISITHHLGEIEILRPNRMVLQSVCQTTDMQLHTCSWSISLISSMKKNIIHRSGSRVSSLVQHLDSSLDKFGSSSHQSMDSLLRSSLLQLVKDHSLVECSGKLSSRSNWNYLILYRLAKDVAIPHMMYGGSAFLFYSVGYDVMRHHADTLTRPKIIDHAILLGIIGAASGALTGNGSIRRVVQFTMFFTLTLAPMSWWFKLQGGMPGSYRKPVNIFY